VSQQIVYLGSMDDARRELEALPAILAGRVPDPMGVARAVQLRCGVALLSEIQRAFITKSRGGVGSDGIKWAPLKPETIARRRTTAGELRQLGIRRRGSRPSLTAAQDLRWRQVFGRVFRRASLDMDERAAKGVAAAIAWQTVKTEGAKTKLELLGGRQVDILRDTGVLFRSLSPGVDDKPSGADGQVFETPAGRVIVGTNVKPWHHTGNPETGLPARPLWPTDGSIPERWRGSINRAAATGVLMAIRMAFGGNG
jgi:hypothetical protein